MSASALTYELEEVLASVSIVIHRYILEGDRGRLPDSLPKDFDITLLLSRSELFSETECAKYR